MSTWELGDLLGIHPHLVSSSHGQPLTAGRCRLSSRSPASSTSTRPTWSRNWSRCYRAAARPRRDADGGQDRRADALAVLTRWPPPGPRCPAQPAHPRLDWQLSAHRGPPSPAAQDNPDLGGPLALRRIPPETWTVTPRLDILTQPQHRALRDTTGTAVLDDDQARVLLAALAVGQKWQGGNYPGLRTRPGWAAAEGRAQASRPDLQQQRPGRSPRPRRRQLQPPLQRRRPHRPGARRAPPLHPAATHPA
jgi:hypothetical protein